MRHKVKVNSGHSVRAVTRIRSSNTEIATYKSTQHHNPENGHGHERGSLFGIEPTFLSKRL
jgi:hypothetical protein